MGSRRGHGRSGAGALEAALVEHCTVHFQGQDAQQRRRRRIPHSSGRAWQNRAGETASARSRCGISVRRTPHPLALDLAEGAGVGRGDAADQVVDLRGAAAASRCARPRACVRRSRTRGSSPAAAAARVPARSSGSTRSSAISAATVTLVNTSKAVSSGRIGTACCATISPGIGLLDHVVQRRARLPLTLDHGPVDRHPAAIARQQRAVHVQGTARGECRAGRA